MTKLETDWENFEKASNYTNTPPCKKEEKLPQKCTEKQNPKASWQTNNSLLDKHNQVKW